MWYRRSAGTFWCNLLDSDWLRGSQWEPGIATSSSLPNSRGTGGNQKWNWTCFECLTQLLYLLHSLAYRLFTTSNMHPLDPLSINLSRLHPNCKLSLDEFCGCGLTWASSWILMSLSMNVSHWSLLVDLTTLTMFQWHWQTGGSSQLSNSLQNTNTYGLNIFEKKMQVKNVSDVNKHSHVVLLLGQSYVHGPVALTPGTAASAGPEWCKWFWVGPGCCMCGQCRDGGSSP